MLFFTIVGGLAIVANVSWQFYKIIIAPVNKHTEPIAIKRHYDPIPEETEAGLNGSTVKSGPRAWDQNVINKLKPKASTQVSAHQSCGNGGAAPMCMMKTEAT